MRISDVMSKPAVTIGVRLTVGDAARLLTDRQISCLPVIDETGKLVGILTHTDFGMRREDLPSGQRLYQLLGKWTSPEAIESAVQELKGRPIREVMSRPVVTVTEGTAIAQAVKLMVDRRINRLPVMRDGEIVGIVTRHDMLKLMASERSA